jgi:hypothetical protein
LPLNVALAQTIPSPEKRALYLKMASVWHQMAQRWEEKLAVTVDRTNKSRFAQMPLWDTVMIALVIGSIIAFCFWARIRATGIDS